MKKNVLLILPALVMLAVSCGTEAQKGTDATAVSETVPATEESVMQISPEEWGEVPGEEEARAIYETFEHKRLEYYTARRSEFSRVETDSQNWILENADGQKLYCYDGLLYGDMPYYRPTDGKAEDVIFYNDDWLYVDVSDKFVYTPGDPDDTGFVITVPPTGQTLEDDAPFVWVYEDGTAESSMTYSEYVENCHSLAVSVPVEFGVYLRNGTGIEKVEIEGETVRVYGENAEFSKIQVQYQNPFEIVFES